MRPWIFRFPIDLLFCSKEIEINQIKTLPYIGTDHLPFLSKFTIKSFTSPSTQKLNSNIESKAKSIIEEGKKAVKEEVESNNLIR